MRRAASLLCLLGILGMLLPPVVHADALQITGVSLSANDGSTSSPFNYGVTYVNVVLNTNNPVTGCVLSGYAMNSNSSTQFYSTVGVYPYNTPLAAQTYPYDIVCTDSSGDQASNSGSFIVSAPLTASVWVHENPPYFVGNSITVGAGGGPGAGINIVATDVAPDGTSGSICSGSNGLCTGSMTLTRAGIYSFTATATGLGQTASSSTSITVSAQTITPISIGSFVFTNQSASPIAMPAPSGTTAVNVGWNTNIPATCQFCAGPSCNAANDSGTSHYVTLEPLTDGFSQNYTLACQDVTDSNNTAQAGPILVKVGTARPVQTITPISISSFVFTNQSGSPITMPASSGTTAVNVGWNTNIPATCQFCAGPSCNAANDSGTSHYVTLEPLTDGFNQNYTLACQDVTDSNNTAQAGPILVEVGTSCPLIPATSYCQSPGCTTGCTLLPPLSISGSIFHPSNGSGAPFFAGDFVAVGGGGNSVLGPTSAGVDVCSGEPTCNLNLPAGSTFTYTVTASTWGYSASAPFSIAVGIQLNASNVTANPTSIPVGSTTSILNVAPTGGESPYSYSWTMSAGWPGECQLSSSSVQSPILTIPNSGYNCKMQATVTDALGNTSSGSVTVQSPSVAPPTVFLSPPVQDYTTNWEALSSTSSAQLILDAVISPTSSSWTVTGVQFQFFCTGSAIPAGYPAPSVSFPSSVSGSFIESNTFANPMTSTWGTQIYVPPGFCRVTSTATESYNPNPAVTMTGTSDNAFINVYLQPIATITYPAPNAVVPSSGPIGIGLNSISAGTVGSVSLYDGTTQGLGGISGSSGTLAVLLSTGPHTLYATAQDGAPDQYGSTLSAPLNLLVVPTLDPSVFISSPAFGTHVLAGTPVTIQAQASAVAAPGWNVQNVIFNCDNCQPQGAVSFSQPYQAVWNSLTAGSYSFNAQANDNHGYSATSNWVVVDVDSPPVVAISSPTNNTAIPVGSSVTVHFIASDPNPGGAIKEVDLYRDAGIYLGSATWVGYSSYTYTWALPAPGTYQLKAFATDVSSWTTWSAPVTVLISSNGTVAPTINQQPSTATVTVGQIAGFSVGAIGIPPPGYQWQVNMSTGFFNIPGATNSYYSTPPLALSSSGWQYRCVVSNSAGSVTSAIAGLRVIAASPLNVTMQAGPPVAIGTPTTFQMSASGGVPPYAYQWQTEPPGSSTWTVVSSATSTLLTITPSTFSQNGTAYRGQVTDSQPGAPNTAFSPAGTLSVPHLTLVYSPIPITVSTGEVAGFLATVAYGMPPYHYEWQRSLTQDGLIAFVDIPGAADSAWYQFTPNDGTYNQFNFRAIVTDSAGESLTTVPSLLTVLVPTAGDNDGNMTYQVIPPLAAGTNFGSVIDFMNTGYSNWTSTGGYVLALQNPAGSMFWGYNTVPLDNGVVLPAGTADFNLNMTLPASTPAGSYPFFWQMQHNGTFFGLIGGQNVVIVSLAGIPDVISNDAEISLPLGNTGTVNYSVYGSGTGTNVAAPLSAARAGSADVPIASMSLPAGQSLDLASLHLSPGNYILQVVMTDGNGLSSPPVSKALTIVAPNLGGILVYPNPWRANLHSAYPITFDHLSGGTTVKIFTVSGRWIRTLPVSNNSVMWNLKNDSGETVQSGLYLYLVTDDQGNKVNGKFAIIR